MDAKKKKIIFAIAGMLILLVMVVLIIISIKIKYNDGNENIIEDEPQGDEEVIMKYEKEKLINTTYFFSIENYINKYLNSISLNKSADVINVLDEKFIKENNFTKDNIISKIEQSYSFLALEMYETRDDWVYSYIVRGVEDDGIYNKEKYYIFDLDLSNFTYKITPLYNKNYNNIDEIKINDNLSKINKNNHNSFEYIKLNDVSISTKYIKYYINLLKNNPEKAYEMLDEEYKKIRFQNNYNNFIYYINQMYNNNKLDTNLKSVSQGIINNKNTYSIKTEKDNRYTIIESSPMDFTIELDEYSVITDNFKQKYKNATDTKKVSTDVDKVMKMINTYDYIGLYNILDESFKNNYNNINNFIKYISDNFYNSNIYEIKDIKIQNNIYIVEIKVYKNTEQDSEYNNKKILIKLQEDTDFNVLFE